MSFACPHFEPHTDSCLRLRCECVPGRPGCAIAKSTGFAVPWEERLKDKQEEKRRELLATNVAPPIRPTRASASPPPA